MPLLLNLLLWVFPLLLAIPIAVLLLECVAAVFPERAQNRFSYAGSGRPRVTVLIPAHNEEVGIHETIQSIQPQLTSADRLVVIADNCTDETAAIARAAGATVFERDDSVQRGKGYALDYGLRQLDAEPPDVVVMMDADCNVHPNCIPRISQLAWKTYRPVQALYLMEQPSHPTPRDSLSALAFLFKNLVRPNGLHHLRQPCLLTGTGMAFPWEMIRNSPLASGNIVEDMQLGLDLAIAGHPPLFCRQAQVTGRLPSQERAARSQRTRWEHGHVKTLLTQCPRLVKAAIQQSRYDLLAIALDLVVPPLSLLVMLWGVGTLIAGIGVLAGLSLVPFAVMILQGLTIFIAIYLGWFSFGQQDIPLISLLAVPLYILWKIPMYFKLLVRPQSKWVRTERDTPTDVSKV
jgi:cellulose synthase/poly-beta-1,6-N-acetylglucosamine synthase-like glycosyltransferase